MRGIFISYRREDTEGQAGRLFDDLSAHYGPDAVFMDVAGIRKGLDFRRIIQEHVTSCGVLLVIIGKGWLSATDSAGKRRLDDPNDFVRLETAAALSRDIPVVPVLVHGASMPKEDELPQALRDLAFRNGTELTHARWESDVKLLIDDLKPYLEAHASHARANVPADAPDPSASPAAPDRRRPRHIVRWAALGFALAGTVTWLALPQPRVSHLEPMVAPVGSAVQTGRVETPLRPEPSSAAAAEPPKVADDSAKAAAAAAQAEAARVAAAKTARAAAARKEAEDQRRREDAALAAQRAEEQRKRDDDARKLAQEQAEKQRQAAEQAAAARVFAEFASAIITSRQGHLR